MVRPLSTLVCGLGLLVFTMAPDHALAEGVLSAETFSGVIVVGTAAASGEPSWIKGGLGKLRAGGDRGVLEATATVAWRGNLTSRVGALVSVDAQSDVAPAAGFGEAYLTLRPDPGATVRISGRAGVFFPPVSLEHDGSEWSLSRTLTPSAINSWVAEEVKVTGAEMTLRGAVAGHPLALTAAAFGGNDTSGALLTFRGWALHDLRADLNGTFSLPDLPDMFAGKQGQRTRPVDEVDGRVGAYVKLDYAPTDVLTVSLLGYDNNGDLTTLTRGQYAWRTRFAQVAARWTPAPGTEILAQAMTGETAMGAPLNGQEPADIGFAAVYVLVSHDLPGGTATARLDQFSVSDHSFKALDNNAEHGWAATAAWSTPVRRRIDLVLEGVVARSTRPDRGRFGEAASQTSLQGRAALRVAF